MEQIARTIFENESLNPLPGRLEGGYSPALVSGLSGIHRACLCASLSMKTERPLLVICPDDTAAETMAADLEAMLGGRVGILCSRDFVFYSAEGVSRQAEQKRLAVLHSMLGGDPKAVVCTAAGLLQRTLPPGMLRDAVLEIKMGGASPPDTVEDALMRMGYIRTQQVEGQGQFARRGGILDFFSPGYEQPVRVEFWGDDVDSMGLFDASSQRRIESIDSCRILPTAETLPGLSPGGIARLADKIDRLSEKAAKQRGRVNPALSSILRQDAERLRETGNLPPADRYMELVWQEKCTALDYVPADALVVLSEPGKCADRASDFKKGLNEDIKALLADGKLVGSLCDFSIEWEDLLSRMEDFPLVMADNFTVGRYPLEPGSIFNLVAKQLPSYGGSTDTAASDVEHYINTGYRVVVLTGDERRAGLLRDIFMEKGLKNTGLDMGLQKLPDPGSCVIAKGGISAGFEFPEAKIAVLTDTQIVRGGYRKIKRKKAVSNKKQISSYSDLSVGDLVVHEYHGIGRFAGIFKMPVDGVEKDYIKICYAGTDSLYVPATRLDLVAKYIGAGEDGTKPVRLSKMGGSDWSRSKSRAKAAAKEMAKELIALYAQRQQQKGHAFAPDSPWQLEFEEHFGYTETEDQLRSVREIKDDMESDIPMDRLLCGDVGYGKTEVALRGVMKCVLDGKQAAILVPTTVLAQQHYQTAMQRFFGYPVRIEVLSRFRTPAQIKNTLRDLKSGSVDIVIGTHRLLQKDVIFKDLGLLIVDEEQRFGVTHKERLKEISSQVDSLTLSATPIPRTLNMALSGIRDMSTIEEPPQDRLPVQTFVIEHDWGVVCDAIRREVSRGGQVYYLHNRVENIERVAVRLADMLESVSVSVAHGKMDKENLSAVMETVSNGECQVLVCTTIIETGIDIPNVNTLIIEDADKLGLAQLHQIRGRVGRSSRRASAYLTFRKDKVLTEIAEKRLTAIREFAEFNSGFKIAMRDLEIRGAGNLLGAEQSGHMIDVGYDMYLKILEEAVLEEKGEPVPVPAECAADLAVSANIPESYVASAEQRMDLYRRIALIQTEEEADDLMDELIDRFGDPPQSVNALVHVALLRGEATSAGISDISQKGGLLRFELVEFDMERISILYSLDKFKGRIKVEAGQKPCVSFKLTSARRVIEQAREFVSAYRRAGAENGAAVPE